MGWLRSQMGHTHSLCALFRADRPMTGTRPPPPHTDTHTQTHTHTNTHTSTLPQVLFALVVISYCFVFLVVVPFCISRPGIICCRPECLQHGEAQRHMGWRRKTVRPIHCCCAQYKPDRPMTDEKDPPTHMHTHTHTHTHTHKSTHTPIHITGCTA